jgi:hypothetical protein
MMEGVAQDRQHNGCHDDMRNDKMPVERHVPCHRTQMWIEAGVNMWSQAVADGAITAIRTLTDPDQLAQVVPSWVA